MDDDKEMNEIVEGILIVFFLLMLMAGLAFGPTLLSPTTFNECRDNAPAGTVCVGHFK